MRLKVRFKVKLIKEFQLKMKKC